MAPKSSRGGLLLVTVAIVLAFVPLPTSFLPVKAPHPDQELAQQAPAPSSRRQAGVGALLAGLAAAASSGVGPARAYELESNRVGTYNTKAKQINDAVDWYIFDVKPLIFPPQELIEMSSCEEFGDRCAEMAGLPVVYEMYQTQGATRGGGQVVVSRLDRELFTPMKTLAMASVFDPDTEDDLSATALKMESSQYQLARAAKKGELAKVKKYYNDGVESFNAYFRAVNAQTSLPEKSEFYLQPIPSDKELEEDYYWVRRRQKYLVKKKVDAMSKGSKTARFYAKSMFGDDAVSWDPRGDRAAEFYQ